MATMRQWITSIPGEIITWAGVCPSNGLEFYGTDSGRLLAPSSSTGPDSLTETHISEESVNSVAFLDKYIAIGSRSNVYIMEVTDMNLSDGSKSRMGKFNFGAHQILAIPSQGVFLVALGEGMAIVKPGDDAVCVTALMTPPWLQDQGVRVYRMAHIGQTESGCDVISVAAKDGGVFSFALKEGKIDGPHVHANCPGLCIVDVQPFIHMGLLGAIALGVEGALHFIPNVLGNQPVDSLSLLPVEGNQTAFGLIAADRTAFVLTDTKLICIPDVGPACRTGYSTETDADDILSLKEGTVAILNDDKLKSFMASEYEECARLTAPGKTDGGLEFAKDDYDSFVMLWQQVPAWEFIEDTFIEEAATASSSPGDTAS